MLKTLASSTKLKESNQLKWAKKLDETLEDDASASQAELYAHLRLMSCLISCLTLVKIFFSVAIVTLGTSNFHLSIF